MARRGWGRDGSMIAIAVVGLATRLTLADAPAGVEEARPAGAPKVDPPHPLITEILFAVPSGSMGDANGDGSRQPIGDEFIEIINPHATEISLKGYVLMDSDAFSPSALRPSGGGASGKQRGTGAGAGSKDKAPAKKPDAEADRSSVRFTFPDVKLEPGQVAVVFNGLKSTFSGPVGDGAKGPTGGNEQFHGALVFTMKNASPYAALSNEADFVLLVAPNGRAVQCVKWGKTEKNPPRECGLTEDVPVVIGSVQRTTVSGGLYEHRELSGEFKGTVCSPGLFRPSTIEARSREPGRREEGAGGEPRTP